MVEDIIRIDDCPSPALVTIEVGGDGRGTEAIRGIHDSLRATSLAMSKRRSFLGAGHLIYDSSPREVRDKSEPGRRGSP